MACKGGSILLYEYFNDYFKVFLNILLSFGKIHRHIYLQTTVKTNLKWKFEASRQKI